MVERGRFLHEGVAAMLRCLIFGLWVVAVLATRATAVSPDPPPNVIVILIDDMGWKDLGTTGSTSHATPHLDALAARGAIFDQAYASAPNCAPTRACLMSGQYSPRHGVYTVGDSWGGDAARRRIVVPENRETLPGESVTIAEVLRDAGYATACIGKWNLGTARDPEHNPTGQGFDEFRHYRRMGFRDGYFDAPEAQGGRYSTDVLFDETIDFVRSRRDGPFFVFLAPDAVHTPLEAPADAIARAETRGLSGDAAVYAAMVERVDAGMGRLMTALDELGLTERTIVVFTSDNGGDVSDNAPLKGKKGLLYEGGVRVPLIMAGPQIQSGTRSTTPANSVDLYPTLLALTGVSQPVGHKLDGTDLRPALAGRSQQRGPMFFHFPAYIGQGEPSAAIRDGDWKLLRLYESQRDELYNLADDPGETTDLTATRPEVAARLAGLLEKWQASLDAPIPGGANPAYDPNAPRRRGAGGQARRDRARDADRDRPAGDEPRPGGRRGNGGEARSDRMPWLVAHAGELDADENGIVARAEVQADIDATMAGYDGDGDDAISIAERSRRVRTTLAGFVKQHAAEIDRDQDDRITEAELERSVFRMFDRADRNRNDSLDAVELGRDVASDDVELQGGDLVTADNEKLRGAVYADNWFQLHVNGRLVATDPTNFKPHDVVTVEIEPSYPMTIAIEARDFADGKTGLEYDNTRIGDAGLILKIGDRVVSSAEWRTYVVSHGPVDRDMKTPRVRTAPVPEGWTQPGFDDRAWPTATVYSRERVRPNAVDFDRHSWDGASFIWSGDLDLDNTVLFRTVIAEPASAPAAGQADAPVIASVFEAFEDVLRLRWDDDYLYIETDAMPDHPMMVGITAWNRQVPLPQPYSGANAWRIPLHPRVADAPIPLPYEGPIAIAANGIPIFNPIKQNRRTDTNLAGELDEFGGHAGRGDDYHYHTAPMHLQDHVGEGAPIAMAIDGYPIYGPGDLEGRRAADVDESGGHVHPHDHAHPELVVDGEDPHYHYHGSKTYPYVHGSFHGEVDLEHRPRAAPVRPAGTGMRTRITNFERRGEDVYHLDYLVDGAIHGLTYTIREAEVEFVWTGPDGATTSSTYERRDRDRQAGQRRRGPRDDRPRRDRPRDVVGSFGGSRAVGEPPAAPPVDARPNIVFMLSDDQSWDGTSVPMHPDVPASRSSVIQTPNLERLSQEGMRFSAAYAPSPVCSPTRASLVTGRSPAALRWTKAARSLTAASNPRLIPPRSARDLPDEETTVAELLLESGYATAHFGKWHIGGGGPERHGFQVGDGDLGNEAAARFTDPNPVDIFGMAERAEQFMEQAQRDGRPFFIQLSWHALHAPENALSATREKYARTSRAGGRQADRAAISEDLDTGVGRVLAALDRLGLSENTYVIYMSDNGGGGGGRGPLSGGKGSLGEGGLRVPFIVRGPGVASGSWCHVPIVGYDLFPTYLEWAGVKEMPDRLEGGSIASLLRGDGGRVHRPAEELVFHFPHYQSGDGPHSAIRLGTSKLIKFHETGRVALYDLAVDIAERHDLHGDMRDRAADLERRLDAHLARIGAAMPVVNDLYDPDRETTTRRAAGGARR
jgi:arylsulfatase A